MRVPAGDEARRRSLAREYLEALLVAVVFALFARTYVVQAFKIPSGSMERNLLVGDHILVNKFVYGVTRWPIEGLFLPQRSLRRGDVAVFRFPLDPTRDFIKRCVGLPGDTVEIVDKELAINGEPVDEDAYVHHSDESVYRSRLVHERYRLRDNFGPYTVPRGHYFCLGDNRDDSDDSRYWGPVPEGHVKGRAFMIYWSSPAPKAEATEPAQGSPPAVPELRRRLARLIHRVGELARETRWERSFRIVR